MMLFLYSIAIFLLVASALAIIFYISLNLLSGKGFRVTKTSFLFLLLIPLALGCVFLGIGAFLEFHEQPSFCGDFCHAMAPHYEAYEHPANNTYIATHVEEHVTCVDCHSGPGAMGQINSYLGVPKEIWGEVSGDYDPDNMHGHVPPENCLKGCHEDMDWYIEAPSPMETGYDIIGGESVWPNRSVLHPLMEDPDDFSELLELEDCEDCHDPRAYGMGLGAHACTVCHDISEEELDNHGNDTCGFTTCHLEEGGEIHKIGHQVFEGHCTQCHDREHPGDASVPYSIQTSAGLFEANRSTCASCHEAASDRLFVYGGPHDTNLSCIDCHQDHKSQPNCMGCHQEDLIQHPVEPPFDDCLSCHIEGGHRPHEIVFMDYLVSDISVTFCGNVSCHQQDVFLHVEQQLSGHLHADKDFVEDCSACHEEHNSLVNCMDCHSELAIPHNTTSPFHDCISCHSDGHDVSSITFSGFSTVHGHQTDFCEDCHNSPKPSDIIAQYSLGHVDLECTECHQEHSDQANCGSCHSDNGTAHVPAHDVQGIYQDCIGCHVSGHDPREVIFGLSSPVEISFCGDCHDRDSSDPVVVFEEYGGRHSYFFSTCTDSCHNGHDLEVGCTQFLCHSGNGLPTSHAGYTETDCLDCHLSAHDPANLAPKPGQELGQSEYMTYYYTVDPMSMFNSFAWNNRGSHIEGMDCQECHPSPTVAQYPTSSSSALHSPGTDCASGCHAWTSTSAIGRPYSLLLSASSTAHYSIFTDPTTGGCAGYCHQIDPSSPDYDLTGHGTITNCLNVVCHGDAFRGKDPSIDLHNYHEDIIIDMGADCYTICHKSGAYYGVPIDGGCYDCHLSGHDPRVIGGR